MDDSATVVVLDVVLKVGLEVGLDPFGDTAPMASDMLRCELANSARRFVSHPFILQGVVGTL